MPNLKEYFKKRTLNRHKREAQEIVDSIYVVNTNKSLALECNGTIIRIFSGSDTVVDIMAALKEAQQAAACGYYESVNDDSYSREPIVCTCRESVNNTSYVKGSDL